MPYKVAINDKAFKDIKEVADWYNRKAPNLGSRFKKSLYSQINGLKLNYDSYPIKYGNMHCMVSKTFPFLIHYSVDDINQLVEIFAIFHTSRSPGIWEERANDI